MFIEYVANQCFMTRSSINRFFGWYNRYSSASFYVNLFHVAAGTESVEHVFDGQVFLMQFLGVFDVFDTF